MSETDENRSIMVVDDDDDGRTMVKTILMAKGYTVLACSNGKEALAEIEGFDPDLVILDIMMPELTGYDVLIRMKQRPNTQNIPVMMLTAKGEDEDVIEGYKDYAVDYYITKPFNTRQLLAGIKLVLGA